MNDFTNNPIPTIQEEVIALRLENAELKKQGKIHKEIIIGEQQEIEELKAQIEQLSNDNHILKTSFIIQQEQIEEQKAQNKDLCESLDIMNNRESELLEQIKKMKCCSNCNGIINGIRQEKCKFCMRNELLTEWELTE